MVELKKKIELKALIIDDEIDICYLLKNILKNKNIEANYVGSISEAKRFLTLYFPTIIFLDNHLPDGLGVEFLKDIKIMNPNIIVIFISGHATMLFKDIAIGAGAAFFIDKPFTTECINSMLDSFWE